MRPLVALFTTGLLSLFASGASAAYLTVGDGCRYAELQAAIDAAHGDDDTIHVRADYHGKPVKIRRKQLYIYGGYPSCDASDPIPYGGNPDDLSWLDGALDGGTKAVVTIEDRAVVDLRNFLITAGHNGGHNGGGISFVSDGDYAHLETHAVDINNNVADTGAGIFYRGNADVNELVLGDLTLIHHNSANKAGGGLRLEGNVHLYANRPATINANTVDDGDDDSTGGGIQLLQDTVADIGSPGLNGLGIVENNHANFGGGIALLDSARLNLYTAVEGARPKIAANTGGQSGGGVFLDGGRTRFCMSGALIRDNQAPTGAALMATEATGSDARIGFGTSCDVPGELGCGTQDNCNLVHGNVANDGSVVDVRDVPVDISYLLMFANEGDHLMTYGDSNVSLSTCNLANNAVRADLLFFPRGGLHLMRSCTIAKNVLRPGINLIDVYAGTLVVNSSIFWEPGHATVVRAPGSTVALYDVIAQDADAMDPGDFSNLVHVTALDPQFSMPDMFNLRPMPASPAIDYAPAESCAEPFDLDGNPKPVDIPQIDHGGSCDIGAYEVQEVPQESPIFRNGFD